MCDRARVVGGCEHVRPCAWWVGVSMCDRARVVGGCERVRPCACGGWV